MDDQGLQFSHPAPADRAALLLEAARQIDEESGTLSQGAETVASALGDQLRALAKDRAELPAQPEVYRLAGAKALAEGKPPLVAFAALTDKHDFYLIRFSVGLISSLGWHFHMLESRIEFNAGDTDGARPRAFTVFPRKEFEELLKLGGGLKVWVNEKGALDAGVAPPALVTDHARLKAELAVSGESEVNLSAEIPTFDWSFKQARIEHSGTGLEWVFWRIKDGKFMAGDNLGLMVVAQVPRGTKEMRIDAELQASRYFNYFNAPLRAAVARIAKVNEYFKEDLPLYNKRKWQINLDAV